MSAAGSDDESARALFQAHYPRVAGWASVALGSEARGHDVAAEAFLRLWSRWWRVRDPVAYLHATAANLVRDQWRRNRVELRELVEVAAPDSSRFVEEIATRDLVDRLPEKLRLPTLLRYYGDLTVAEISQVVGRPEGTVKRQLSEARASLGSAIREQED